MLHRRCLTEFTGTNDGLGKYILLQNALEDVSKDFYLIFFIAHMKSFRKIFRILRFS